MGEGGEGRRGWKGKICNLLKDMGRPNLTKIPVCRTSIPEGKDGDDNDIS